MRNGLILLFTIPSSSNPIHIVRILPDEAVFAEMEKRIRVADDIVKELIEAE